MTKCKHCGTRIIKRPLWRGQELGEPFSWNKVNWKNALLPDWLAILIIATILFSAWAYKHDTQECFNLLENPCDFVDKNRQSCDEIKKNREGFFIPVLPESRIQFNKD